MQRNFVSFLILSLCMVGCSTAPTNTKFDGKWEFHQVTPFEEPMACLPQADVKVLRELLIRCKKGE